MRSSNASKHRGQVDAADRERLLGQKGGVVWLTGLSGSGKSTLAYALERHLVTARHLTFVLDGDNLRSGLCSDLAFSPEDRAENIRRVAETAALFAEAGVLTIAAFISPYEAGRARARETVGRDRFIEVFLDVPLEVCERRDPKGLYGMARAGLLPGLTGVSAPYERPRAPDVSLDTEAEDVDACVAVLVEELRRRGFLAGAAPTPRGEA